MTSDAAARSKKPLFVGKYKVDITSFEEIALPSLSANQQCRKLHTSSSSGSSDVKSTPDSGCSETRDSTELNYPKRAEFEFENESSESTVHDDAKSKIPQSSSGGCVVVIDEIGKMELFSQPFVSAIRSLFDQQDSDVIVLATIPVARHKCHWLVEEIRHRSDCLLFEVPNYIVHLLLHFE